MFYGETFSSTDEFIRCLKDYIDYYKTERGYHPRSGNSNDGWTATASGSLMNMRLFEYAPEIRSAVLLVHGENAHSLMYSQDTYKLLKGDNKEIMIIPGASHTDLYDQMDIIPFDKLETFFKDAFQENLEDFWYIDKELSKENKNLRYRISDLVIKTEKRIIKFKAKNVYFLPLNTVKELSVGDKLILHE